MHFRVVVVYILCDIVRFTTLFKFYEDQQTYTLTLEHGESDISMFTLAQISAWSVIFNFKIAVYKVGNSI